MQDKTVTLTGPRGRSVPRSALPGADGLTRYNMELQMTLLALGMTSAQLEQTVKSFSR